MKPFHLLVLGGGSSQLNLIGRARRDGIYVTVADIDPDAPGRDCADGFVPVSTFDTDGIVRAARDLRCDAIVAAGSDQPVYTAAEASARLGLFFPISPQTALGVTDKRHMKHALAADGIPVAPWRLLEHDAGITALAGLEAPYVIKPVDSQGQRGISLLPDAESVIAHIPRTLSFSRQQTVLVERYYPSNEVTVSGWVHRGQPTIFTVTDRVTISSDSSLGVCVAHRFPSAYARGHELAIRSLTEKTVRSLQITDGPIYFQMLVGCEGVIVNEAACRLGGAYEDESIPLVTGVDPLDLQLRCSRGESPRPPEPRHNGSFCVPLLFCLPGRITRYGSLRPLSAIPEVVRCCYLLPAGTRVRTMENSTQRVGYAVVHAAVPGMVNDTLRLLFETVRVFDENNQNILMDTSAYCRLEEAPQ